MSKSIRKILYSTLAVFMAVVMAALSPVRIFAARGAGGSSTSGSTEPQNKYIKDIIIVAENEMYLFDTSDAYSGYTIIETPLYPFAADNKEHSTLYLAVATTDKPNEAITDIKAMNMNGEYDYQAYADYLSEMEAWAGAKAQTTLAAVKEFRANYLYNKPSAVFAYDMLNYLTEDGKTPLGEALVKLDKDALNKTINDIVFKSNLIMLTYIRQLLLVACSETLSTDFVTALRAYGKNNPLKNGEYDAYRTAADDLRFSMVDTSRMIRAYRSAIANGDDYDAYITKKNEEVSKALAENDENSEKYQAAEEENENLKDIIAGQLLCGLFDETYYEDDDKNKYRLTDILAMDPEDEDQSKRPKIDMLLPIVALMSDGQRGLAGCGFDKLVASVINDYSGKDSEYNNSLEEIKSVWQAVGDNSLISVYSGVDLSLYDPNGIAMVGKSREIVKKSIGGDNNYLSLPAFAAGILMGGALVGIVGSCVGLSRGISGILAFNEAQAVLAPYREALSKAQTVFNTAENAFTNLEESNLLVEEAYSSASAELKIAQDNLYTNTQCEMNGVPGITSSIVRTALYTFMLVLSIALFITTLIALIQELSPREVQDTKYIDVPRVLVNAIEKTEYDYRNQMTTKAQMIFYKGIIDPFMSDNKAEANLTPSKVMDVFDWSLTGKREWIALYATRDGRAGNPILANDIQDSLAILIETPKASHTSLMQGYNDRVKIFGKTGYVECGSGVIAFNHGDVKSDTKSGLGYSANMTIESGAFILYLLLAAMGGAGIAVLSCFLINKRNKKKETA